MNARVIGAVVLVGIGIAAGVSSFRKSVTPYVDVERARLASGAVQVNGEILDRRVVVTQGRRYLEFNLKDTKGEVMPVVYHGSIPANFDEAAMVVAVGRYRDGRFEARQLLVKCPSKYQAQARKKTGS